MKRPTPELLDISRWPSVDVNALEDKARLRYQKRVAAVEHYAAGAPLGWIESQTEIHRRVLYRMIERALQAHPDGRPWGFRALIPGSHTKAYERRKASKSAGVGLAGAFNQLLDRQPKLEKFVRQLIESRDIRLVQRGERVYLKNLRNAHNRFMAACRSLGLRDSDYPLNQEQQGLRSLGATLRQRRCRNSKRPIGPRATNPTSAFALKPAWEYLPAAKRSSGAGPRQHQSRGKAAHQLLPCALHESSFGAIAGAHWQDVTDILFRGRHSHFARISRRWH